MNIKTRLFFNVKNRILKFHYCDIKMFGFFIKHDNETLIIILFN